MGTRAARRAMLALAVVLGAVGLSVTIAAGPVSAAVPKRQQATAATADPSLGTWMHDLGPRLAGAKLRDLVIPGSHDSGTYALGDDLISRIGKAQTEDITHQLNDGIRDLDIRVAWYPFPCRQDFFVVHGLLSACSLDLPDVFQQIEQWTLAPGHEQEIILVGLTIDEGKNGHFPLLSECTNFDAALGSALLTPSELKAAAGTADPGQVTMGKLWSMPGHPRVILNNSACTGDTATWSPATPFGAFAGTSYYANQCYADGYTYSADGQTYNMPGIAGRVLGATWTRATQGGGDDVNPGNPVNPGPPMIGGLWTLFAQATPTASCLKPLDEFDLGEQEKVLHRLYLAWYQNGARAGSTWNNVNIVSGDFVQEGPAPIGVGVIAMDKIKFPPITSTPSPSAGPTAPAPPPSAVAVAAAADLPSTGAVGARTESQTLTLANTGGPVRPALLIGICFILAGCLGIAVGIPAHRLGSRDGRVRHLE